MNDINEILDLVNKINEFYENSWNKLIIVAAFILAVIGVIWPLIINMYQKRKFKNDENRIINNLNENINKKFKELEKTLEDKLNKKEKDILNNVIEYKNEITSIKGGACHIQANTLLNNKFYPRALESFIFAAFSYIDCKDEYNLQTVLNIILSKCFPNMDFNSLNELDKLNQHIDELFSKLDQFNENKRYTQIIDKLKIAYKKLENKNNN